MTENFKLTEFACPCCGGNDIQAEFVHRLQMAREIACIPFKINSGWRCKKHNAEVKGVGESAHSTGYAADLISVTSSSRFKMLDSLRRSGFNRFGIGKTFVHVDCDPNKPPNVMWVY